jgi:hypothetical protein
MELKRQVHPVVMKIPVLSLYSHRSRFVAVAQQGNIQKGQKPCLSQISTFKDEIEWQ